jgi:hypothetical protein
MGCRYVPQQTNEHQSSSWNLTGGTMRGSQPCSAASHCKNSRLQVLYAYEIADRWPNAAGAVCFGTAPTAINHVATSSAPALHASQKIKFTSWMHTRCQCRGCGQPLEGASITPFLHASSQPASPLPQAGRTASVQCLAWPICTQISAVSWWRSPRPRSILCSWVALPRRDSF